MNKAKLISGLDAFTRAYLEAALWSSMQSNGTPLDKYHDLRNFSMKTLKNAIEDCAKFQLECAQWLTYENCNHFNDSLESQAGHDFWLTRNGHGCGFWDGDWIEYKGILAVIKASFKEIHLEAYKGTIHAL